MDEFAFLTLMLLINHRIPHVLVEFYDCRFLAKNKGKSHPLIQGAKAASNHASPRRLTWIGEPTSEENRHTKAFGT